MLINISDVISEQHKTVVADAVLEMEHFRKDGNKFEIKEKSPVHIVVEFMEGTKIRITGKTTLAIIIPCDRCLEDVDTKFNLDFTKEIDLDEEITEPDERLDEKNYMDGCQLNVERLVSNELLIEWPMKILCNDDCKGICNVCGQNLNKGTCNCEDTGLDPRMAAVQDIFKQFKL